MNNLKVVCNMAGISYDEVAYLIGTGVIPEHLVSYEAGKVMIDDVLVGMLSTASLVSEDSGVWIGQAIKPIMEVEKKRWASEQY